MQPQVRFQSVALLRGRPRFLSLRQLEIFQKRDIIECFFRVFGVRLRLECHSGSGVLAIGFQFLLVALVTIRQCV